MKNATERGEETWARELRQLPLCDAADVVSVWHGRAKKLGFSAPPPPVLGLAGWDIPHLYRRPPKDLPPDELASSACVVCGIGQGAAVRECCADRPVFCDRCAEIHREHVHERAGGTVADVYTDFAAFALRCRRYVRERYTGKLPEAIDRFEEACVALECVDEILDQNGIALGGMADLEPLMEAIARELEALAKTDAPAP